MKNITKEQEEFLNNSTIGTWKVNQRTGLVDIDGLFDCSNKGLSDFLGIEFGGVEGYFDCSFNKLVSLEGAPQKVGRTFFCVNNNLVSLEGAPIEVRGDFYCYNNQLVSLEGSPKNIMSYLFCDPINLRGCPINLLGKINFYRRDNQRNIRLEDLAKGITDGLAPEIYLNKMI